MESLEEIIRKRLIEMSAEHGMQKKLAVKAQVSIGYFNRVLAGAEPLTKKTISNLSDALGIDFYAEALRSISPAPNIDGLEAPPVTLAPESVKSIASELNKYMLPPMTAEESKALEVMRKDTRAAKLIAFFIRIDDEGRDALVAKAETLAEIRPAPPGNR